MYALWSLVTTESYELQKDGKWHEKKIDGWGEGGIGEMGISSISGEIICSSLVYTD